MELSIIIPTYNRARLLERCIESIIKQQPVNVSYEVIVVDNGSTDNTRSVCMKSGANIKNFEYCFDDVPGLLTGRHKGFSLSRGSVVSFIDDDAELNPQWIESIVHQFNSHPEVSIIGGPCLPKYESEPPSWVEYFWQATPYGGQMCLPLSLIDIGLKQAEINPLYVFGLNYSIRREAVIQLAGFHPDCIPAHLQKYQGDGETGLSIKAGIHKLKAMYVFDAWIHHHVATERMTPEYFEKWNYYDGVCQSYTDLRKIHHLYDQPEVEVIPAKPIMKRVKNRIGSAFRRIFNRNGLQKKLPAQIDELKSRFKQKYHEGYAFHQDHFFNDKLVKEWVLKAEYWDYTLPVPTENYF